MNKVLLDILSKVIWAVLCGVCTFCITQIKKLHKASKSREEDLSLIKAALRHTLRNVLMSDYNTYKERGWCSHLEKEEYSATYDTYHALNGNGVMTHKDEEVLTLPDNPPVN